MKIDINRIIALLLVIVKKGPETTSVEFVQNSFQQMHVEFECIIILNILIMTQLCD